MKDIDALNTQYCSKSYASSILCLGAKYDQNVYELILFICSKLLFELIMKQPAKKSTK